MSQELGGLSNTGESTPVRLDILFMPDDRAEVADLLTALTANGIDVHPTSGTPVDGCPLAVLITTNTLEPTDAQQFLSIAANYDEVLPVSFLPGAAPLFADLSQSIIGQLGVPETATRLASIARFGGRAIVSWNALVGRAADWRDQGQHALLPERDIAPAFAAMQTRLAQASSQRELVSDFLTASQAALSRRRHIRAALVTASIVVLSAVLTFALVQGLSAKLAQDKSRRERNVATADRLARNAIDLIPGNPDLPLLLLDEAMRNADTAAVQEAQQRISAATWPHLSIRLGFIPLNVTAARTMPRVAIADTQQQKIVVYDDAGAKEVGRFAYNDLGGSVGGVGRLSPDGALLATESEHPGSLKIIEVGSGSALPTNWLRTHDEVLTWLDNHHLLLGREEQLVVIDTATGNATTIGVLGDGDIAQNAELSPDGHLAVVTSRASHTVVDTAERRVLRSEPDPNANHAVISDDGALNEPSKGELATFNLGGDYRLATHTDGLITLAVAGTGQTVRAHLSDRVRAEPLSDGRIATVGSDGYLRVWTLPTPEQLGRATDYGFTHEGTRMASAIGVHVAPRESARNQIRIAADDSVAVTLLPGSARVVSAETLDTVPKWFFTGLDTDVFLSRDGSRIASTGGKHNQTFHFSASDRFWDDDNKHVIDGTHMQTAMATGAKGVAAVNDDGTSIVYADEYGVESLNADPARSLGHSFEKERRPVALWAGAADDPGCALTVDGILRCADGSEQPVAWPDSISDDQRRVAAGEFSGSNAYTLVTDDGKILEMAEGRVQQVGDVGTGYDAFAFRSDPSGRTFAVIGKQGLAIYDRDKEAVVYREPSHGAVMVTDVAFTKDRRVIYAVTALGCVKRIAIAEGVPRQLRQVVPRELTEQERTVFALNES